MQRPQLEIRPFNQDNGWDLYLHEKGFTACYFPERYFSDADLLSWVDDIIERSSRSPYVIISSSELPFLRLRRRVAEGKLAPSDVGVFLHEDQELFGESVPINPDGSLDVFPHTHWNHRYEEVRALLRACASHKKENRS